MYEWPDLPDGYYSFWGTEPQRPDRILKDLEQRRRVILNPQKPRVWFFGDSFVQCPDDNIWEPISKEFNPVHRGVGGTGVEAIWAQLSICKDHIQAEDRVVIAFSHHDRELLRDGIRGQPQFRYRSDTQPTVTNIRQYAPVARPYNSDEYTDFVDDKIWTEYLENVRWELSNLLKVLAMVNNIVHDIIPSLKTPHVAHFACFGLHDPQIHLLRKYNFSEKRIRELTQHLQNPRPLWGFALERSGYRWVSGEGWVHFNPEESKKPWGERKVSTHRHPSPNHYLDEDVVPFWNSYKGTLEKLCLDQPLYK